MPKQRLLHTAATSSTVMEKENLSFRSQSMSHTCCICMKETTQGLLTDRWTHTGEADEGGTNSHKGSKTASHCKFLRGDGF